MGRCIHSNYILRAHSRAYSIPSWPLPAMITRLRAKLHDFQDLQTTTEEIASTMASTSLEAPSLTFTPPFVLGRGCMTGGLLGFTVIS